MLSKLEFVKGLSNTIANVMIITGHVLCQLGEIIYSHDDSGLENLEIIDD